MADLFSRLNPINEQVTHDLDERILEVNRLKKNIQSKLPSYFGNQNIFGMNSPEEHKLIEHYMREIISKEQTFLREYEIAEFLEPFILELTSLGILSPFMEDPEITEIMVNAYDEVWVEKKGTLTLTDVKYDSEDDLMEISRRIARNIGRLIDNSHPYVDARLPDGSRVHIVIPPLARKGVTVTIRKFFKEKLEMVNLVDFETLTTEMGQYLQAFVRAKTNLLVSGGTGSGKTTTLNILSNFVPDDERIITIEDSAELQLNNSHVVTLETKNANTEGKGDVTMQDLVKQSLRMRPDRIIIGEVRDKSAYDLLNAMSTGHEGSMSSVHANDPKNTITRLTNLVSERNLGFSTDLINTIIGQSVDIIVQISRMSDKTRKVTHISQVYVNEDEKVVVEPIFEYKIRISEDKTKLHGDFVRTKNKLSPDIVAKLILADIDPNEYEPKN